MNSTDASTSGSSGTAEILNPPLEDCSLQMVDDPTRSAVIGDEPVTIGSGPRSVLRIEEPGVKPLACVVSRRGDEIAARRWSNEVLLNDEEFAESTIQPGDRLSVGPVQLELVSDQAASDSRSEVEDDPTDAIQDEFSQHLCEDDAQESEESTEAASQNGFDLTPEVEPADLAPADEDWRTREPLNAELPEAGQFVGALADDATEAEENFEEASEAPEFDRPARGPAKSAAVEDPWLLTESPFAADYESLDAEDESDDIQSDTTAGQPVEEANEIDVFADVEQADQSPADEDQQSDLAEELSRPEEDLWSTNESFPETDPEPHEPQDAWGVSIEESVDQPLDEEAPARPATGGDLWDIERAPSTPDWLEDQADSIAADVSEETTENADAELSDEVSAWAESHEEPESDDAVEPWDAPEEATGEGEPEHADENEPAVLDEVEVAEVEVTDFDDAERLRRRLDSNKDRVRRLVASFRESRSAAEAQASSAAEAIESLQTDLDSTAQRCVELTTSNDDLREELATAVAQIEALESEARRAETESASVVEEPAAADALLATAQVEEPSLEALEETEDNDSFEPTGSVWSEQTPEEQIDTKESIDESPESLLPVEDLWEQGATPAIEPAPAAEEEAATAVSPIEAETPIERSLLKQTDTPAESLEAEPLESDAVAPEAADAGGSAANELWAVESSPTVEEAGGESEPEAAEQPESFYERYAHLLPADDEETPVPTAETAPPAPVFQPRPEASANEDDDESIDDYLKQMMSRIRGDNDAAPSESALPAAPTPAQPAEPKATLTKPVPLAELREPSEPLVNLDELRPREAPERDADMGSLRQLANQSARKAFVTADVNQSKEQAQRQLIIALFAFCCGGLAIFTAPALFDWRMLIGMGGVLIGGYLAWQTFRDLRVAVRNEAQAQDAADKTSHA